MLFRYAEEGVSSIFREEFMAHIVVLGAGLGGIVMAYEMREKMREADRLTVVNLGST